MRQYKFPKTSQPRSFSKFEMKIGWQCSKKKQGKSVVDCCFENIVQRTASRGSTLELQAYLFDPVWQVFVV